MPPLSTDEYDTAVNLVLGGMAPVQAWESASRPGKNRQAGLSNIRARVKRARRDAPALCDAAAQHDDNPGSCADPSSHVDNEDVAATPVAATTEQPLAGALKVRRNGEVAVYRLKSSQVDKKAAATARQKRAFIDALKESSAEYAKEQQSGGRNGTTPSSAAAVATVYNEKLPRDVQLLTGGRIYNHVRAGLAGCSPPGKGPKPVVPKVIVDLMSTHASMSQINGNELKPRAIRQAIAALVSGTTLEQHLKSKQQRSKFLKRLRQSGLTAVPKVICDNRRWMYLTYKNVDRYFDGLKYFYISEGFGEDTPEVQLDGSTSELTFSDYMKRRLSIGDETHQRMSNCGDKSGSRATTYVNPLVVRSGSRKVESQKHITTYLIVNAYDEVGPYTAIFDTTCEDEEDRKLNVGWTAGLPRVNCQFGFAEVVTCEPVVMVTPKGGTCEDALEKIIELSIAPLYPDLAPNWIKDDDDNFIGGPICHRLDGGPGRTGQASLPMRMRLAEKGIYLFPSGPQNCTAACQEPDQIFGLYKQICDEVTDEIISERITKRATEEAALRERRSFPRADGTQSRSAKDLTKVELTNFDLPRVVNGRHGDPIERRPFSHAFRQERVAWGNRQVGAVPFTRAALNNPKVRKELDPSEEPDSVVRHINSEHQSNVAAAQLMGLTTAVVEAQLPRRYEVVAPPTSEEDIIKKLVEGKCSQAAMWINCGAVAFNSSVMNKAGCAVIQNDLDSKADKATGKLAQYDEAKREAQTIVTGMRAADIVNYADLEAGQPKALVRFYHVAKGEAGMSKYSSVASQVSFLDGLEDDKLEELLRLDAPIGFEAPSEVESVATMMLKKVSDSTRRTIDYNSAPERDVILSVTGAVGAADGVDEAQVSATIDAASAGFSSSDLAGETLLDTLPPLEKVVAFRSSDGHVLKGREIMYKFKEGWFRGRVLKQNSDGTIRMNKRICNFRVFFEADDEMLNQPLYSQTYAQDATGPVHTWMLLASSGSGSGGRAQLALEGPATAPLALMSPATDMDTVG